MSKGNEGACFRSGPAWILIRPRCGLTGPAGCQCDAKITEDSGRELTRLLVNLPAGSPAPPNGHIAEDWPCHVMLRLVPDCP